MEDPEVDMTNEDRTQYENSGRHGAHRLLNGGNP